MSRTTVYSGLVLRNRPSNFSSANQQTNSEVTLLTAEEGIIVTTVFGGPKSKLRSHSAPYNSGQVWIYRDPAKDYRKLSDFDVHSWRPGLRELYDRTMAAAAIAQTVLASHGGGSDWGTALKLVESTLDALANVNEELCPRLLVQFLWRWTGFLGIQPEIDRCSVCEEIITDSPLWFNSRENSLLCESCVPKGELCPHGTPPNQALSPREPSKSSSVPLNPGSRRWLAVVDKVEPSFLYRYSMDNKSFDEAKTLTTAIMTGVLGKRLSSWDW
jgi:DNA repair protein RecO (recombination protein O)